VERKKKVTDFDRALPDCDGSTEVEYALARYVQWVDGKGRVIPSQSVKRKGPVDEASTPLDGPRMKDWD
jgi:hypothetical protein